MHPTPNHPAAACLAASVELLVQILRVAAKAAQRGQLTEREYDLVQWYCGNGLTCEELADELGEQVETVESDLSAGLAALMPQLVGAPA